MTAVSTSLTSSFDLRSAFSVERRVRAEFERAGITIGGHAAHDLRVLDPSFFRRIAMNPAYELGQTYVDGLWECDAIDRMMTKLLAAGVGQSFEHGRQFFVRSLVAKAHNLQSRLRAKIVIDRHYDLGDELFAAMLDESMAYTCAIFETPETSLADAQQAKMRVLCNKLELASGETFLDIGCGWGGLLDHAARVNGARVTGITISKNQHATATERVRHHPGASVRLMDYRDLPKQGERYAKVAAVEMIEAVGPKNYETFFRSVHDVMEPGGRFVLQCFISHRSVYVCNEWFDRHIFPNGVSPSLAFLSRASESTFGAPSVIEDIGLHYDPTLMAWNDNFEAAYPSLVRYGYDERFRRMWRFYLTSLAGVFRAKHLRCYQIVYEKPGHRGARAK